LAKICPKCRLTCPDEAERCDCGYNFTTGYMPQNADTIVYTKDGKISKRRFNGLQKVGIALMIVQAVVIIASIVTGDYFWNYFATFKGMDFFYAASGALSYIVGFFPAGILGLISFLIGRRKAKKEIVK